MKKLKQNLSDTSPLQILLLNNKDVYQHITANPESLTTVVTGLTQDIKDLLMVYFAVKTPNIEYVKLLLNNGANIHVHDDYPIQIVSHYNNPEMMKCFLDHGANLEIEDFYAVRMAETLNHQQTLDVLNSHMTTEQVEAYKQSI